MSMNEACNVAKILKGKPLLLATFSPVNSNTCSWYYIHLKVFFFSPSSSSSFKFLFTSVKLNEKCRDYPGANWLCNVLVPAILQLCFNFSWPLPNMLFIAVPLSGSLQFIRLKDFLIDLFFFFFLCQHSCPLVSAWLEDTCLFSALQIQRAGFHTSNLFSTPRLRFQSRRIGKSSPIQSKHTSHPTLTGRMSLAFHKFVFR